MLSEPTAMAVPSTPRGRTPSTRPIIVRLRLGYLLVKREADNML